MNCTIGCVRYLICIISFNPYNDYEEMKGTERLNELVRPRSW